MNHLLEPGKLFKIKPSTQSHIYFSYFDLDIKYLKTTFIENKIFIFLEKISSGHKIYNKVIFEDEIIAIPNDYELEEILQEF